LSEPSASVNQISCQIFELDYCLTMAPCDRCQQPASRFSTSTRNAIDLNLDHPVLLHITVSVHHCVGCHHYFRAQPPFLRPKAIYTNRVVHKAVQSVFEDRMVHRLVPDRMGRDFWVRPSEGMIRSCVAPTVLNLILKLTTNPGLSRNFPAFWVWMRSTRASERCC
jgi:hypothetical protein